MTIEAVAYTFFLLESAFVALFVVSMTGPGGG
jgi:hypothetical protein